MKVIKCIGKLLLCGLLIYGWVLIVYFIHKPFIKSERDERKDLAATLNRDMLRGRDYHYLLTTLNEEKKFNPSLLKQYRDYFQRVYQFRSSQIDALGLSGFCAYYLGDIEEAKKAYQAAIDANPHFFWYYYNLGVIYYNQGRTKEAALLWSKGLSLDPAATLQFLFANQRSYIAMLKVRGNDSLNKLSIEIKSGYAQVAQWLRDLADDQKLSEKGQLSLKLY